MVFHLNFSLTIALFLGIPLLTYMFLWLFQTRKEMWSTKFRKEFIWECEICLNVYSTAEDEEISKCPFCGSYNKRRR
jgi:hypothetical protein